MNFAVSAEQIAWILGTLSSIFAIYRFVIQPKLDAAKNGLADTMVWRTKIEHRVEGLEKEKDFYKDAIESIRVSIEGLAERGTQEHRAMRELLQSEVRRLEDSSKNRSTELFGEVKELRTMIMDKLTKGG